LTPGTIGGPEIQAAIAIASSRDRLMRSAMKPDSIDEIAFGLQIGVGDKDKLDPTFRILLQSSGELAPYVIDIVDSNAIPGLPERR
jgi:hypothetical protein